MIPNETDIGLTVILKNYVVLDKYVKVLRTSGQPASGFSCKPLSKKSFYSNLQKMDENNMEDKVSSISIRTLIESRIITFMTKIFSHRESFGKTVRIF